MSKSHHEISHLSSCMYHILCVLGLTFLFSSCGWQEAKEVIATADSLDQTEHVIYDDTAALGKAIRCLDNPFGRVLMSNTLGKAYYYMGRNYSISNQIAEAAGCYIEADRLQIDDPIYRGRVNSCMGYICAQNNDNDSLSLIFYNRASEYFKASDNNWYHAQILLNRSECCISLHNYFIADSLLQIAESYQLDSAYRARYYETKGLYFYEQQEYDSALIYFNRGLEYWQREEEKSFSYMKVMQIYLHINDLKKALPYSKLIIKNSNNLNYISNAYYCLMQDAREKDDTKQLSTYSHARTDAQKQLRNGMIKDAEAFPVLEEYLTNPDPLLKIRIVLFTFVVICIVLIVCIFAYRKQTVAKIQVSEKQIVSLSAQMQEHQDKLQEQGKLHYYKKHLDKIRRKYPKPLSRWNEYTELKKDIQSYLHDWFISLEKLDLTNREKVFCVISFIYPQMATEDLANYLCITKEALPVRKNRIAKKLGITSVELGVFLQKLANRE